MKANDFRELSLDELKAREKDLREEIFNLRFRLATGQLENTAKVSIAKRDLARLLTVLNEKQVQA
jgi:large subunit ribosomal protein L29